MFISPADTIVPRLIIFHQVIEKDLEENLDVDNAIDLLVLSESLNTPKLKKACVNAIAEKFKAYESELKKLEGVPTNTIKHIEFLHSKRAQAVM